MSKTRKIATLVISLIVAVGVVGCAPAPAPIPECELLGSQNVVLEYFGTGIAQVDYSYTPNIGTYSRTTYLPFRDTLPAVREVWVTVTMKSEGYVGVRKIVDGKQVFPDSPVASGKGDFFTYSTNGGQVCK